MQAPRCARNIGPGVAQLREVAHTRNVARKMTAGMQAAGRELRRRRNDIQLTQEELAENSGASRRAIQDFEAGLRWPRESTLGNLEHALGWDRGYLSEYAARIDAQSTEAQGDVGEQQIQEMPYLLPADRELFLKVYRTRRDDDAVLRLAELERNREGARTHPDKDVAAHLVAMIDRQIQDLRSRGYESVPVDTES